MYIRLKLVALCSREKKKKQGVMNASNGRNPSADIIFSATNFLSLPVCIVAIGMVVCFKLYKTTVYRLALYQVLASLDVATIQLLEIAFVKYQNLTWPWPDANARRLCIAMAWLQLYSFWLKILFTSWVTFHLFCFGALQKNMKKLEALYVVSSLLVPVLVCAVPLVTHTYGFSPVDGCYIPIYEKNYTVELEVSVAEKFLLLDAPAMLVLLVASAAMIAMVIKLTRRVCYRISYQPITAGGDQYSEALKQILPLAAFPIIFFIFIIPVFVFDIFYSFLTPVPNTALVFAQYIFISFWSLSSGVTLIVHISLSQLPARCKRRRRERTNLPKSQVRTVDPTFTSETSTHGKSYTIYSLPPASL